VAAARLGLEVAKIETQRPDDIAPALEGFTGPVRALYVVPDALANANHVKSTH
jgi:hypothetical protein